VVVERWLGAMEKRRGGGELYGARESGEEKGKSDLRRGHVRA
jgi:hypothetical protein